MRVLVSARCLYPGCLGKDGKVREVLARGLCGSHLVTAKKLILEYRDKRRPLPRPKPSRDADPCPGEIAARAAELREARGRRPVRSRSLPAAALLADGLHDLPPEKLPEQHGPSRVYRTLPPAAVLAAALNEGAAAAQIGALCGVDRNSVLDSAVRARPSDIDAAVLAAGRELANAAKRGGP